MRPETSRSDTHPSRPRPTSVTRLSEDAALTLYHDADLLDLGDSAMRIRRSFHGDGPVTFLVDRNINYTNICVNRCRFCAFFRDEQSTEAFLLSHDEIEDRVDEAVLQGATQIMLQGGLHPGVDLEWFTTLFGRIKKRHIIHLHSLSPPEIHHLAESSGETISHVLFRLAEAGLDSLPGGGAEILVDHVRRRISPLKIRSAQWLAVMEKAHAAGIPTTATMMFGAGETSRDRIEHLRLIRDLQDKTGGYPLVLSAGKYRSRRRRLQHSRLPPNLGCKPDLSRQYSQYPGIVGYPGTRSGSNLPPFRCQ